MRPHVGTRWLSKHSGSVYRVVEWIGDEAEFHNIRLQHEGEREGRTFLYRASDLVHQTTEITTIPVVF